MFRKILTSVILGTMLFLGENAMAETVFRTGAETVLFGLGEENTAYAKYFVGKAIYSH